MKRFNLKATSGQVWKLVCLFAIAWTNYELRFSNAWLSLNQKYDQGRNETPFSLIFCSFWSKRFLARGVKANKPAKTHAWTKEWTVDPYNLNIQKRQILPENGQVRHTWRQVGQKVGGGNTRLGRTSVSTLAREKTKRTKLYPLKLKICTTWEIQTKWTKKR